jgi:hypothetical protein
MQGLVQPHLHSPRCRPCVRARRADARALQIDWDDLMESLTGGPTPLSPLFQPSQSTATTCVRCRSVLTSGVSAQRGLGKSRRCSCARCALQPRVRYGVADAPLRPGRARAPCCRPCFKCSTRTRTASCRWRSSRTSRQCRTAGTVQSTEQSSCTCACVQVGGGGEGNDVSVSASLFGYAPRARSRVRARTRGVAMQQCIVRGRTPVAPTTGAVLGDPTPLSRV